MYSFLVHDCHSQTQQIPTKKYFLSKTIQFSSIYFLSNINRSSCTLFSFFRKRKNFLLMILETLVYEERHYNNSVIEIGIGMCFLNVQFLYLHFHLLSVFMTELEYICIEKYYTYVIIGKSSSHTSLEVSVG